MATPPRRRTTTRTRGNGAKKSPTELKTLAVYEKYVLGTSRFMEIPTKDLYIDRKYQRELSDAQVKRISNGFDIDLFEPPTVNDRGEWDHYKGQRFALIDGQHRWAAAKLLHMDSITCRIVTVSPEKEAELFVFLNRQRLWLSPVSSFKAELQAGNPAAKEIVRCLAERDLEVGTAKYAGIQRTNGKAVMAIAALKRIYAQGGHVGLGRVLDIAKDAWPEDDNQRFSGQVLLGLDTFLGSNKNVDLERLANKLQYVTGRQLLAKAQARWYAWKGLDDRNAQRSTIDAVADEIGRIYRKR